VQSELSKAKEAYQFATESAEFAAAVRTDLAAFLSRWSLDLPKDIPAALF
jgi:hypothetical protein